MKIIQEFSKWDDEMAKHVIGLLHIDLIAPLYHSSVDFYHLFFYQPHIADCHVI